jgi:pimeloyl-ACP methyl ester carboxylesterase
MSTCARAVALLLVASPVVLAQRPDTGRTARGIFYESRGGGRDVIVLVHAFSMDRRMWDDQVAALRGAARVVRYDLRAHGKSAGQTEPFSATDDLLGLLDELRLPSAHLVGLSSGAAVALDFALTHRSRVRSLVLASPGISGFVGREPMTWMTPVIDAVRAGNLETAAERWAETPLMQVVDSSGSARIRTLSQDNRAVWGNRVSMERPLDPPAIGRLGEVRVPTLVVSGERDLPDSRRAADTLAHGVPGAHLVVVPGAGHMVNIAAPRAFNNALISFLRTTLRRESDVRSR